MTIPVSRRSIQNVILTRCHVISRSWWGTRKPLYNNLVADWAFDSIAIHHSGNDGMKDPKEIEYHHMVKNRYDDVGYHFLIHPTGTIYEGREIVYKGSHVQNANSGKIGILMMGDFDHQWWDIDDDLSNTNLSALNKLITTLQTFFPIRYLGGHKEYLPNQGYSCPGSEIMAKIDGLRGKYGFVKP